MLGNVLIAFLFFMPRPAKPTNLLVLEGKTHLTKKDIADRLSNEIRFGNYDFKPTEIIKKDKVAFKKWNEIIKLYTIPDPVGFATTASQGLIERYCLTYSEYMDLRQELELDHSEINKKLDLLLKMEKELLLTPASTIRSIGKNKKEKQETPLEKAGFGNV